jgi:hypothetical protein
VFVERERERERGFIYKRERERERERERDYLVRIILFGFFRTADLGQQYDMVSRVGGNCSYLSTQTFFSVSHSAWYALSLPKSVYLV